MVRPNSFQDKIPVKKMAFRGRAAGMGLVAFALVHLLPSVTREYFTEHPDRLGRVTPGVTSCIYLLLSCSANRFALTYSAQAAFYFARTFRKGGESIVWHTNQQYNSGCGGHT